MTQAHVISWHVMSLGVGAVGAMVPGAAGVEASTKPPGLLPHQPPEEGEGHALGAAHGQGNGHAEHASGVCSSSSSDPNAQYDLDYIRGYQAYKVASLLSRTLSLMQSCVSWRLMRVTYET